MLLTYTSDFVVALQASERVARRPRHMPRERLESNAGPGPREDPHGDTNNAAQVN